MITPHEKRVTFFLRLAILMLVAAASSYAQTHPNTSKQAFATIADFDGSANGAAPEYGYPIVWSGTKGYGTTLGGGAYDQGTVFEVTASGTITTLYSFCSQVNCTDGAEPLSGPLVSGGNIYGTTLAGGANGAGTIFEITPAGKLNTLYSFCSQTNCTDGAYPVAGLVKVGANFYGTTVEGGASGFAGTVFEITPAGQLTTLYNFCSQTNCADGAYPYAGLVQATNGNLYGTTSNGGTTASQGTVFEITLAGQFTTLYSFCSQSNCSDGAYPLAGLVQASNGNFYGTTEVGGIGGCYGCGTVFEITPAGQLTTLYSFCSQSDCSDGDYPSAGLVQASDGNLYGTTQGGGVFFSTGLLLTRGTVFGMTLAGQLTTLHNFSLTDGAQPQGGLVEGASGNLYGVTYVGGSRDNGTIFSLPVGLDPPKERQAGSPKAEAKFGFRGTNPHPATGITPNGMEAGFPVAPGNRARNAAPLRPTTAPTANTSAAPANTSRTKDLTTVLNFDGANGASPFYTSLLLGTDGNFYGTTESGGTYDQGIVFKVTPGGTPTTLYTFCSQTNCTDGAEPYAGLVQATSGNFYGTTAEGGANGRGTVFEITPAGQLTTLYSFCSQDQLYCTDGDNPQAVVVQVGGNFYGTTAGGGASGRGTVFEISPAGQLTTLYSFCSQPGCSDGANPVAGLVQASNGNLYGTTSQGGTSASCYGCEGGTVFEITLAGQVTAPLYSFCSQTNCTDGYYPVAGLIQGANGNLYGTTEYGGAIGAGTVFEITPEDQLTTFYSFCSQIACTDGEDPVAGLIQDANGNLYGTTEYGGPNFDGTVFAITPAGQLTTLHSFDGADGAYPQGGLLQSNGTLYGIASSGGNRLDGTLFSLAPVITLTCPTGTAEVGVGYSSAIAATGGVAPYTFSIVAGTLPPGLTLNAATGAITGTPTTGGTYSFVIQAVDSQGNTVTSGCTIALPTSQLSSTTLSIAPLSIPVGSAGPIVMTTTVAPVSGSGTPTGTVTYYLNSTSGTQIGTSTLSNGVSTFDYNPSSLAAGTYLIVAIYGGDSTFASSDAFQSLVILPPCTNNGNLKGNYGFLLQGWSNFNGSQTYALNGTAGSLVFDGNGNVTSGQYDRNDSIGGPTQGTLTGTYCIPSNNLGTMTINAGGHAYGVAFVMQPNGNGNIIPYDAGWDASGVLLKQNTSDFSTNDFTGQYSLGFIGVDNAGSRFGLVGAFTANGTANLTNGELDGDDGGKAINGTFSSTNFNVTSSGRGTFSLNISGVGAGNFAFYVVNSSQLLVVQIDPLSQGLQSLFSGQIVQQQGLTYSDSDLNGVSVLGSQGLDTTCNPAACPDAQLGLVTWNGSGAFSYTQDENDGGTLSSNTGSGTYSGSSNGRVTVTGSGGGSGPIFYLTGKNAGFAVDNDNQKVNFGSMVAQSGSNFNNTSLSGNYYGGTWELTLPNNCGQVDLVNLSSGSGTDTVETDCYEALFGGSAPFTYSVSSNGRAVASDSNDAEAEILYVVTPSSNGSGGSFIALFGQGLQASLETFVAAASKLTLSCPTSTAQVGSTYSSALSATGGVAPYTFSITTGSLPPGLTLNAATGAITGTPTTAGTYTVTFQVMDSQGNTATATCTIVVSSPTLELACPTGTAAVEVSYTSAFTATGGVAPYTFSIISGSLPPELSVNSSTGAITGTPNTAGTYNFTAQVADSQSNKATASCTIVVSSGSGFILEENFNELTPAFGVTSAGAFTAINGTNVDIVTGSLCASPESGNCVDLDGSGGNSQGDLESSPITLNAGTQYNLSFDLIGSQRGVTTSTTVNFGPYSQTFVLASNDDTDGIVSVPVTVPTTTVTTLQFQSNTPGDIGALLDNVSITVGTSGPQVNCSATNSTGEVGVPFNSGTITVTGGTAPYTFSIVGTLPAGLTLNPSTGVVSGTPTSSGTFSIQVTDAKGMTGSASCPFAIFSGPQITCPTGTAQVGVSYSSGFAVAGGGVPPYTFTITSGSLPPGLTLNPSTGTVTGTPTTAGTYNFTAQVVDSQGNTATTSCTIVVSKKSSIVLTCASGTAQVGIAYSSAIGAAGGVSPYTYSIIAGSLPPGLALNSSSGAITGTPKTAATYTFSVQVTDSKGNTATSNCTIVVSAASTLALICPAGTAQVGIAYSSALSPTGGVPPYTFSSISGSLPPGLSLNLSNGPVTGTPTTAGTYNFTAQIMDSQGNAAAASCSIVVASASSIPTSTSLTLTPSNVPVGSNGPIVITATVTPVSGSGKPSGTVTYFMGSTELGTATLSGGVGTFNYNPSSLAVGIYSITAAYSGNNTFSASTSSAQTLAINQTGPFAYVANQFSNTVSVINIPTGQVTNTITVGASPVGAAVSPNGNQVYVTNGGGNSVSVINTASGTVVATIPGQSAPLGVAFTPDGTSAYVANQGSNSVSVINTASQKVVATVPVQSDPIGVAMAYTSNGTFAYVTNAGSNTVSVIAVGSSPTVVQTIPVGTRPQWVVVSPNSSMAYVENTESANISVISVATNTVTATIPVGLGPYGAAFTPDSSLAYVANQASNTVSVIDTASATVVATVAGFNNPIQVALTADGASAYVTNNDGNSVSVISTSSNTITGTIAVGSNPGGVALASAPQAIFQITQPLSPTQPNTFNFGANSYAVQYPSGTQFSGFSMTVASVEITQAQFQQRVAGTQFANTSCIVYSGAAGNCIDQQVTCSQNGSPVACPSETTSTIAVQTSFSTAQQIVNPGYLTTPIGQNNWTNIFSGLSDITVKGKTKGFSEFIAVDMGTDNPQGAGKMTFQPPLASTDPREFAAGTKIAVTFQLTSIANPTQPITDAMANLTLEYVANASGQPQNTVVLDLKNAFSYSSGVGYVYQLNTSKYPTGTYLLIVYGNAFAAQQVQFSLMTDQAPAFTSANATTFDAGMTNTFTVTTSGFPIPTITESGALPAGVTFVDNGNGTGALSGTPTAAGVFNLSFTAQNGIGTPATQAFTLTVMAQGDFTVVAAPSSLTMLQNSGGTSTIEIKPSKGFDQLVTLSASGVPSGVKATFATNPTRKLSTLTLSTGASVAPGTYTITVTGTAGSLSNSATITLTVTAASFTLSATPNVVTVARSSSVTSTIAISRANGFSGSVTLAAVGLPSGVTASFSPNPATSSSTLTLTATDTAALGTMTVTITGTSGSQTSSTTLMLTVEGDFTVLAVPSSLTVQQNSGGTTTIEIKAAKGFDQPVTLSASGMPSGVKATFDRNPTRSLSTLTVSAGASVAPGTYTITVTGTAGSLSDSAIVTLSVTAP